MINLRCGWDWKRRLIKHGGCGIRVGYDPIPLRGDLPITPYKPTFCVPCKPHFHRGVPYCHECIKGFDVVHLGQGVCVRPKEESDVPVGGPKLEELYQ